MKYSLLSSLFLVAFPWTSSAFHSAFVPRRTTVAPKSSTALSMVAENAKVILVTGSSRGLGRSIALDLGAHGQKVIVNYVSDGSKESAEKTVEDIKAAGGDAIAIQADSECEKEDRGYFLCCQ